MIFVSFRFKFQIFIIWVF